MANFKELPSGRIVNLDSFDEIALDKSGMQYIVMGIKWSYPMVRTQLSKPLPHKDAVALAKSYTRN